MGPPGAYNRGSSRVLRAPNAAFLKATCVAGLNEVECHSASNPNRQPDTGGASYGRLCVKLGSLSHAPPYPLGSARSPHNIEG